MLDQGRSQREAGRVLGLSQSTINEYLRRFRASGLPWPLAPDADEVTVAARFFTDHAPPVGARPLADCPTIHAELRRKGVTLQLLWIEYTQREPDGYPYTQCCRHYHAWADTLAPALRQVHIAGEKCFVDDAGLTMPVVGVHSRDVRDAQIFVGALGASHYWYADARWSQSLPDWIASHVGMVEYFGGVSARLVPDHLRAGVTTACYYEPVVKPTYQDFDTHYGTAILPTRVAAPRDTAKVFAAVLAVCDGQGLIGREMFAIDGVKLPSIASTHRSGTRAEFTQRAEKLETAARTMLERHRETATGRPMRWSSNPMWRRRPPHGSRDSRRMRNSCASGSRRIICIAVARLAGSAKAIARTMRARRWRPIRVSSTVTRAWRRWMPNTRSLSTRKRMARTPNRSFCCRSSRPLRLSAQARRCCRRTRGIIAQRISPREAGRAGVLAE